VSLGVSAVWFSSAAKNISSLERESAAEIPSAAQLCRIMEKNLERCEQELEAMVRRR